MPGREGMHARPRRKPRRLYKPKHQKPMSILFDWYENVNDARKPEAERRLHPRPVLQMPMETAEIARHIEQASSMSRGDIAGVLSELSRVVAGALGSGRRVHIEGLGYFRLTLESTEPVYPSTPQKSHKVRLKAIRFQPEKALLQSIPSYGFSRMKLGNHARRLDDADIDRLLGEYFATHPVLTRARAQSLFGLTESTAHRLLRRLVDEGRLRNAGTRQMPMYVLA